MAKTTIVAEILLQELATKAEEERMELETNIIKVKMAE